MNFCSIKIFKLLITTATIFSGVYLCAVRSVACACKVAHALDVCTLESAHALETALNTYRVPFGVDWNWFLHAGNGTGNFIQPTFYSVIGY